MLTPDHPLAPFDRSVPFVPDREREIEKVVRSTRAIFERVLTNSLGSANTEGTCLYAAILLATTLNRFARTCAVVCGGGPPMDGGLIDSSGSVRGHYWVEGATADGSLFLADITSDQFGFAPVILMPLAAARARYTPGDHARIATHVTEERIQLELEG